MGKICWGRVFLGGLLAGVVANVLGVAAAYLFLESHYRAALEELGRPLQVTTGLAVFWIVFYFVAGILAVWLYAAIRPRYGPGPKTAVGAGVAFWLISYLLPAAGLASFGLFPLRLLTIDAVTYLVVMVVATLVGAWTYKE